MYFRLVKSVSGKSEIVSEWCRKSSESFDAIGERDIVVTQDTEVEENTNIVMTQDYQHEQTTFLGVHYVAHSTTFH
jgi:hypothetical protein